MGHIIIKDEVKSCETQHDGHPCTIPATVYAGGKGSGDWAGHYCRSHIPQGFVVWDTYEYDLSGYASVSTTFGRSTTD